jgi:hypothetical protein
VANVVHGVEVPWPKLCPSWADDDDDSRHCFSFFEASVDRSSFLCVACLPWVKT